MLDFANPYYLFLLFLIPAVGFLYLLSRAALRKKIRRFGRPEIIGRLMPNVSKYKPALKIVIRLLALAALVIAIARPRYGEKEDIVTSEGSEIVLAFDVSRSMLAPSTDDPGSMSRIERSKMLLEKLVNELNNDKIGLVIFAENARMQMPLTSDRRIIQMALKNDLNPGMMSNQGTSLSQAIEMSMLTFPGLRDQLENPSSKSSRDDDATHRAIILLTDAEDHEGDAIELAREAAERGIQIDIIGVGTKLGGKIPIGGGNYLRDNEGNEVVTTLNDEAAKEIAQAGGGTYVNASDPNALQLLKQSLDNLKKEEFEHVTYKMSAEQFPLFVWICLILLILDFVILDRKTAILKGVNFFTRQKNGRGTSLKK